MKSDYKLVISAAKFAREAHESIDQRRKYSGEPYFSHPEAVALLTAEYTDDPVLIAAAYLHDTVEDVTTGPRPVTHAIILDKFGAAVSNHVVELTNTTVKTDGNRAIRKAIERERLANISGGSQLVKCMDIIHNVTDLVQQAPDFAKVYLQEKKLVLEVFCRDPFGIEYYAAAKQRTRELINASIWELSKTPKVS